MIAFDIDKVAWAPGPWRYLLTLQNTGQGPMLQKSYQELHKMKIQIKLMGMLKDRTPENGELELPDAATIGDVLAALEVDPNSVQVFSVNGSIERSQERSLQDGDELTVLPPVGGG